MNLCTHAHTCTVDATASFTLTHTNCNHSRTCTNYLLFSFRLPVCFSLRFITVNIFCTASPSTSSKWERRMRRARPSSLVSRWRWPTSRWVCVDRLFVCVRVCRCACVHEEVLICHWRWQVATRLAERLHVDPFTLRFTAPSYVVLIVLYLLQALCLHIRSHRHKLQNHKHSHKHKHEHSHHTHMIAAPLHIFFKHEAFTHKIAQT